MSLSVAAGAKTALKIADLVSGAAGSDDKTLKRILTVMAAAIGGLVLLIAAVIAILTSPIQYIGKVGDFQQNYSYIITTTDNSPGAGGTTGTRKPAPGTSLISDADAQSILGSISDPNRKAIIKSGLSLLGRVSYFWGGKSAAGWNKEWGSMKMVTADGSHTTGTYEPYGLDCSGFVDWCYKTAGIGTMLSAGGTGWQWSQSYEVSVDELQPGDLVFKNPGSWSDNHVGLYVGRETNGKMLFLHCSGSSGVVLNSYSGFKYFRRVPALNS